ncbi:ABC transporter substrate-binding protein [Limoniibacter endophyticus]|uniref:ABC transporter substrate-binding protein n=1 Tax=Limoniibacter endophyticus TaxID=1565040 RepID=A0A8J3DH63_9HYPH|nr:ABC transporter substrate-binding protein [Limoniibacter endophyticus]GHC70271.1 ABC transporter substrate-binding protein [Limoniibacter endophyticus]
MKTITRAALALLTATALTGAATAQEKTVKIGLIYTLSGPSALLGEQSRDAFLLAAEKLGNKFGGLNAEIIVQDDEQKPDVGVTKVQQMIERDKVDFVVGPIFSNVLNAIVQPATSSGAFLISTNAGTSNLAGKDCNPNLFVTSYQNDQMHEVSGKYAQDQGYSRVVLIAPNYQAGKDALAGFKHSFKGEASQEIYVPLGQLDYSAELAQIAADAPDAVYAFLPGGMGVNFVKQYRQAGLEGTPFLSAFTVDETTLPAQQDAAIGFFAGSNWAPDLDTPEAKEFTAAYEEKFKRVPATYAVQAYDAAMLIDSAIKKVDGNLEDKDALRAAMKSAEFKSPRGQFSFGDNHFPIQDFYLTQVVKREDGQFATSFKEKIFDDYKDNYAAECKM